MNWKVAILFCARVSSASAKCPNENQSRDSRSLLHMEDFWVRALTDHTAPPLDCLLAQDFSDSDWKGNHLTRAEVLDAASKRVPPPTGAKHHFEDISARIYGDTGIVNGVSYWIYADGTKHSQARFTDVFVYRDHHWLAIAGHETAVQE